MCHKQEKEAQVDSKPEVSYKPLQVVQSKSEKEFKESSVKATYQFVLYINVMCHTNVIANNSHMCETAT